MPGKPAARVGDPTAHGGTISGPGCATVLIGGMPACVMGDQHVCPMQTPGTPPIPHVGGPIIATGVLVLIGGKPAATVGDTAICTGPPATIVNGCATVLIGAGGGGGGGAGSGGSAKSTSDSTAGTETQETHFIDVKFKDKSGKPITGVQYKVKTPDGKTSEGNLAGQIKRSGLPEGSTDIELRSIVKAAWSAKEARNGDKVKMQVEAVGMSSGAKADFEIWKKDIGKAEAMVGEIKDISVSGGKAEAEWTYDFGEEDFDEDDVQADAYSAPQFFFIVRMEGVQQRSGMLDYKDFIELELTDEEDKPVANAGYRVYMPNGEVKKGKLDGNGYAKVENIRPGKVRVEFDDEDEVGSES